MRAWRFSSWMRTARALMSFRVLARTTLRRTARITYTKSTVASECGGAGAPLSSRNEPINEIASRVAIASAATMSASRVLPGAWRAASPVASAVCCARRAAPSAPCRAATAAAAAARLSAPVAASSAPAPIAMASADHGFRRTASATSSFLRTTSTGSVTRSRRMPHPRGSVGSSPRRGSRAPASACSSSWLAWAGWPGSRPRPRG